MRWLRFFGIILLFVVLVNPITAQEGQDAANFRVGFYNVENLFDIENDPLKEDDDFTPAGKQAWSAERYATKLDHVAEVMVGLDFPSVMGLAEIENEVVLAALVQQQRLQGHHYGIVHYESPDTRGIDVALLYDKVRFTVLAAHAVLVKFPTWLEPEGYTSRDILYARLQAPDGAVFHFFVNHWPSRRGGAEASEHRRLWAASHLRRAVDEVLLTDPLAKVIIMGDFNDEPNNRSLANALGTLTPAKAAHLPGLLYNPGLEIDTQKEGSYNYRNEWNMLDQVIYAGLEAPNHWRPGGFAIFKPAWLSYTSDRGPTPNRTYGGTKYYGGYSDHFPVYFDVVRIGSE